MGPNAHAESTYVNAKKEKSMVERGSSLDSNSGSWAVKATVLPLAQFACSRLKRHVCNLP